MVATTANRTRYIKAEAANSEFVSTFEEFLREVWVGITYVGATSSSNPTDDSKIAELAEKLSDMLLSRRQSGNLSREEFAFVSMMSWFHMTLEFEHADRPLAAGGSHRPREPAVQDRRARRAAGARTVEELLRHRRSDLAAADPDRDGHLQRSRSCARTLRSRQFSERPRIGHAHDHHALDGDHRPRREGSEGRRARLVQRQQIPDGVQVAGGQQCRHDDKLVESEDVDVAISSPATCSWRKC